MSKFAIDPGHGDINGSLGGDGGAVGYINEQNCALDIANRVINKLKSLGHEAWNVRPSSATSVTDSLQKRCDAAVNADYLVSIHLNAFDGNGHGTEVYAMSSAGKKLAEKVINNLSNLGWSNRGVKFSNSLYVLRHSDPVAILIEVCFVDNKSDAGLYNRLGANTIANSIVQSLTGQTVKEEKQIKFRELEVQRGSDVKEIQKILYKLGLMYHLSGFYDMETRKAIVKYQKSHAALKTTGIVDKDTWNSLMVHR